ncbi:MAG TPA: hybrid sensor histidine kinase/response regulator [Leptospiraceae bacterium]|nr:hybrid sensor histidine kinase/response regulator [Leptospiraceae bacterium]HMW06617.1 hybrid sensor histidine kinase/response regulator [Leptospiraceae bacterium]HMX32045.1 hybrid sensor histidine kinase/response regulator [Leptospiraceae bacterium]HMY31192.1 hybrid sensor histidine kinase/response regulator [Leptospiraceae bacterium]HMZ63321.1 hybrid sensor histidine kinase/response regulator [Leptospiraceae bacterium]
MSLDAFAGAKILIVDDEPANLRVLYNLLKDYPLRLFTLQDSKLVMNTVEKELPDIILLDIMMPGINGFELCKMIKKKDKFSGISIIFISALNDINNMVKGFELGAVDYISKPFQNEEILIRLKNQLTIQFQKKDLTKLVEDLEQKNQKLIELDSMKNKFFSIIAHDVRNPFAGILGLSEILSSDFDTLSKEEMKKLAEMINSSTNKCYKLLENLLNWAKSQLNNVEIRPIKKNLKHHVEKIFSVYQLQADNKNITLNSSIPEDIFYYADENLVDLVIRNLVNNAIKFTNESGSIEIYCKTQNDLLEISVKDSGIGMPPSISENLFKLGKSVTRKGSNKEDGTGLGLLVCYEFIQKSGGNISVISEEGKGSIFTFTVPCFK